MPQDISGQYFQARFVGDPDSLNGEDPGAGSPFWNTPFGQFLEGAIPILGNAVQIFRPPPPPPPEYGGEKGTNLTGVYIIGGAIILLLFILLLMRK